MSKELVLEVKNLKTIFKSRGQEVQAVRGVEFSVEKGEIMGIVGESGSGKSVTMKAVMGILPENAKVEYDSLKLNGKELAGLSAEEYRKLRGKEMTMIFQDPMTALNPLKKIGSQLEEVILRHSNLSRQEAKEKAIEMLRKVGIPVPEQRIKQYPHEFSGGMRQRVLIAMALACEPQLLIADEPTTALDLKEGERLQSIDGVPPSLIDPPVGCPFAERCEYATERCYKEMPKYKNYSETHRAMCFLNEQE